MLGMEEVWKNHKTEVIGFKCQIYCNTRLGGNVWTIMHWSITLFLQYILQSLRTITTLHDCCYSVQVIAAVIVLTTNHSLLLLGLQHVIFTIPLLLFWSANFINRTQWAWAYAGGDGRLFYANVISLVGSLLSYWIIIAVAKLGCANKHDSLVAGLATDTDMSSIDEEASGSRYVHVLGGLCGWHGQCHNNCTPHNAMYEH